MQIKKYSISLNNGHGAAATATGQEKELINQENFKDQSITNIR